MGGCNAIATEHRRYGLSCMQKLWSAQAVLSLYGILVCKLCCEIVLLLTWQISCMQEGNIKMFLIIMSFLQWVA